MEDSLIVQTDFNGRNKLHMEDNKCFCLKTFLGLLQINIITLAQSLQQPYPPKICLIPTKDYRVEEVSITADSINVNLPEPILNDEYNDLYKFKEFYVQTYERQHKIPNLTQFTEYTLKLALSNFYIHKKSMDLQFGPDVKLITTSKLYAPDDVVVQVVMPNLAVIDWMPPKKLDCVAVNYEVKWMQYSNSTQENQNSFRFIKVNKLEHTTNGVVTDSVIKTFYMAEPNNLSLNGIDTNSMNISWIPSVNLTIPTEFLILEYKNAASRKRIWEIANNIEKNNDKITYHIENLLLQTKIGHNISCDKNAKKQASSKEKKEFLKEAKLMSHFQHENVLRILGICLNTDSLLLILELIEPGDLLNYLRINGTLQSLDSCALRLKGLLAMCEDVARGCCYLERQQFVHRDLACRNCLISVRNHGNRIVKIGLARDIYKDHYYRM
ncbi:BDNF/NT-3 growth factors receptor-like, partial [Nylanderia fulva]|uniref:BDNF/NT-3 growth factors receptor-like n=1 Tax=Nylanderia fulva TaxID=613905 RepID=UPI0010FB786D